MTDEIIKLARECGDYDAHNDCFSFNASGRYSVEAFYRAAYNAGLERAAACCDYEGKECNLDPYAMRDIAAAIRALKEWK